MKALEFPPWPIVNIVQEMSISSSWIMGFSLKKAIRLHCIKIRTIYSWLYCIEWISSKAWEQPWQNLHWKSKSWSQLYTPMQSHLRTVFLASTCHHDTYQVVTFLEIDSWTTGTKDYYRKKSTTYGHHPVIIMPFLQATEVTAAWHTVAFGLLQAGAPRNNMTYLPVPPVRNVDINI